MLRLRRRARRDAGVRRLYRWSQHPRRGVRKNIPDPGLHGACARRRQAAHHRRVALLLNISKLEGRLSSSPLPLWERSDRIDRCDPGEGLRTIYRREPLTPTLSHKGRGSSPPPLQVLDSIFKQPTVEPSLRANGSRECAPDDRLHEAIHLAAQRKKMDCFVATLLAMTATVPRRTTPSYPAQAGPLDSIISISGILDRPPSRAMTSGK